MENYSVLSRGVIYTIVTIIVAAAICASLVVGR